MEQDFEAINRNFRAKVDPATLKKIDQEVRESLAALEISIAVRTARKKAHMTQAQLSAETGITQSEISRIEKGRYSPRLSTLFTLASALKTEFVIAG